MYEVLGKFTKNRDLKSCGDRKTTENTLECAQVEKENIKRPTWILKLNMLGRFLNTNADFDARLFW